MDVGLYGVIAYSVARRTREIGARIVLGAEPRNLLRAVVRRGLFLGLLGAAIGLPAVIGVAKLFRTVLYGVSPKEPATLAAGAAVLIIVAGAPRWSLSNPRPSSPRTGKASGCFGLGRSGKGKLEGPRSQRKSGI
jgi:ABC-type antimicrobial peptide transport system permease subunit